MRSCFGIGLLVGAGLATSCLATHDVDGLSNGADASAAGTQASGGSAGAPNAGSGGAVAGTSGAGGGGTAGAGGTGGSGATGGGCGTCPGGTVCKGTQCEPCGTENAWCCTPPEQCPATGFTCSNERCVRCTVPGSACCGGNPPICDGTHVCDAANQCQPCGANGQLCCAGGACNANLAKCCGTSTDLTCPTPTEPGATCKVCCAICKNGDKSAPLDTSANAGNCDARSKDWCAGSCANPPCHNDTQSGWKFVPNAGGCP